MMIEIVPFLSIVGLICIGVSLIYFFLNKKRPCDIWLILALLCIFCSGWIILSHNNCEVTDLQLPVNVIYGQYYIEFESNTYDITEQVEFLISDGDLVYVEMIEGQWSLGIWNYPKIVGIERIKYRIK